MNPKLSAASFGFGLATLIMPMSLTLLLTGENEDVTPSVLSGEVEVAGVLEEKSPISEAGQELNAVERIPQVVEEKAKPNSTQSSAPVKHVRVPTFAGFEETRFQRHDALIAKCVAKFNDGRAKWAGSTAQQARGIPQLTVAQVKAQMIQESGGADAKSRAAWMKDPLQVNVPGDWSSYKKYVGLHKPRNRNEGSLESNLRAGIMMLARKGFGESGQPAANRPSGRFDGWRSALQRYNGRSDMTVEGRPYREVYANRILARAARPNVETELPIRRKR